MTFFLSLMRMLHPARRLPGGVVALAFLLAALRLAAEAISATCFSPLSDALARMDGTVHLHAEGDRDHCAHRAADPGPLVSWACNAQADEAEYLLPDVPRLPVPFSTFVPLLFVAVFFKGLTLFPARGRAPPPALA